MFNRPFRDVAREYLLTQEARAKRGEISAARPKKLRAVIEGTLDRYAGSTQVHLIGDERWGGYATLRLQEGVDVNFLAEQMGTSVHMIESHYGHVNTIKHADRVLQGMAGWEVPQPDDTKARASKAPYFTSWSTAPAMRAARIASVCTLFLHCVAPVCVH